MFSRLLTIAPVPSTVNLHHLRIHLLPHPPSSRVSRPSSALRALPAHSSSSLSSLVFPCCSRASSRAEFIPPAKYPRVHLLISPPSSPFRFPPPPIVVSFRARFSFPLSFILIPSVHFVAHVPSIPRHPRTRASSNPRFIFSLRLLLSLFFYIPTYILDKVLHGLTAISSHFLRL